LTAEWKNTVIRGEFSIDRIQGFARNFLANNPKAKYVLPYRRRHRLLLFSLCMSKTKILIVDDDAKLSHLLAIVLSRVGGHEVREENRSFAAVHTAREFCPDLILLDVDMPGEDGEEISAKLSADHRLAQVPVIFVTSLIDKGEAGMRNGHPYLAKPVDPMLLLQTVRCLCQRVSAKAAA